MVCGCEGTVGRPVRPMLMTRYPHPHFAVRFAPEAAIDADVVLRLLRMAVDDVQKSTAGQTSLDSATVIGAIRRMANSDDREVCVSVRVLGTA